MHDVQGSGLAVIFHRGGVLFFVIDVMVTVVFEVSLTSCVVNRLSEPFHESIE